jgi:glutamine amidotransferase
MRVAVVDYGMGNLDSVARAVEECGGEPIVTDQACDFEQATHIILPGVGSFAMGIRNIRERQLDRIIGEQVFSQKIPLLGICLGMQLLATTGFEGGETAGLGWIEGEVRRLQPNAPDVRIPHVGWNEVHFQQSHPLLQNIESSKDFYFVHSYHFQCRYPEHVLAWTPYCDRVTSMVGRDNIFGVQFHPEKSQRMGFQILKNFLAF